MEQPTQLALEWFSTEGFMPHGHCYLWTPELLWAFVISQSIIVLAYFSIPFGLMYFVHKRKDLQFNWMFKLFSVFIFACGTTHLLGIWTIWHPDYWLDALAHIATAATSLATAILLWPLIPKALKLPSTQQLEAANSQLRMEVEQRKSIEADLLQLKNNSDERYHNIFKQAAAGVAEVDSVSGALLNINQRFCDIHGYEPDELLGTNSQSLTHPDDWLTEQIYIQELISGRISEFAMEKRGLRKDGSLIWLSITASATWKPDEKPGAYIAIVQDISSRKQAEEKLQEKLDELQRWQEATQGRETRILELKQEVNELLADNGKPARYASVAAGNGDASSAKKP